MKDRGERVSVKKICVNGMGVALFVVMTLCLQVPVFENYYLCLGYIAMTFYTYYFGTASGIIVGTVGVFLYCLLTSGLRGMPGWILGNIVIGLICGIAAKVSKKCNRKYTKEIIMIIAIIISTAIGILVVKSLVEVALYSLPFMLRVANNIFAFVADVVVLVLGFEICIRGEDFWHKILNNLS